MRASTGGGEANGLISHCHSMVGSVFPGGTRHEGDLGRCRLAIIMFIPGNNPQPDEENHILHQGWTGNTVTGSTNISHIGVNFSSTPTLTIRPAMVRLRIEATSGGSQVALSDIAFAVASGTFSDAIFDMHIGGTIGTSGGTATITALDNLGGISSFTTTLKNGSNFLTVVASNGESIENIAIAYTVGFTDLRQVRISGALVSVPDNGATAMLLGGALAGLVLVRRYLKR